MQTEDQPTLCFIDCETTGLSPDQHAIWEVALILRSPVDAKLRRDLIEQATRGIDPASAAGVVPLMFDGPGYVDQEYVWQLPVDEGRADQIAMNIGGWHERRWPEEQEFHGSAPENQRRSLRSVVLAKSLLGLVNPNDPAEGRCVVPGDHVASWCRSFSKLTWGAHVIGMVPSFDTERLGNLLRMWDACPGWHYQPIDVETLAVGFLHGRARGIALTALSDPQANAAVELERRARERGDIEDKAIFGTLHGIGSWRGALEAKEKVSAPPYSSEEVSRLLGVNPDKYDRHSALGDARWARDVWDAVHKPPQRPMPTLDAAREGATS